MDFGPCGIANEEAAYLGPVTADAGGLIQWIDPSKILAPSTSARLFKELRIMTALEDFDRLLKQTMGLDIASIGASALERAVQERQRECSVDDTRAYLDRVRASKDELQALIETIVVPETWFFRDQAAFAALVRFVREEWLPTHADGCLRLLSVPCSTGEEPYSMAMALLDANVPPGRFRIDAIDICERSLAHARRGIYGKGSFRGDVTAYRERYFEPVAGGHALSGAVRPQVNFQQGNLLNAGFLPGADIYDVVFCRNLLIYFDRATQDQAVSVLDRLLTPKGILFAGSSESGVFVNHRFSSAKLPMAFAFRKGRPIAAPKPPANRHEDSRTSLPAGRLRASAPVGLPLKSGCHRRQSRVRRKRSGSPIKVTLRKRLDAARRSYSGRVHPRRSSTCSGSCAMRRATQMTRRSITGRPCTWIRVIRMRWCISLC